MINVGSQPGPKAGLVEVELSNEFLFARLVNVGATLRELSQVGESGSSLCLGLADPVDYLSGSSYIGVTAGPVANRIGGAAFKIGEQRFQLESNEGVNQLHGGPTGFSHKLWDVDVDRDRNRVRFTLHRPDGEGGYPGNLDVEVRYELQGNRLRYQWTAATDLTTPVSLANHAYWNLGLTGTVADHTLQVRARKLVAVDDAAIPSGELPAVTGTAFDLRQPRRLGSVIEELGEGIDHCFVLEPADDGDEQPVPQIVLGHPRSGRRMAVTTTLPGVQVYTGQFLDGSAAAGGFAKYGGVCLETQQLPDAVNQPSFPSCLVEPGLPVSHTTDYVFHL